MELFTLISLSAAFALSLYYFILKAKKNGYSTRTWSFGITAIILIPFGAAWAATSFGEGEPMAAYMGILIFSGLGLIFGLLAYNSLARSKDHPDRSAQSDGQSSTAKLGVTIALIMLISVAAILLPLALGLKRTAGMLGNKASVTELVAEKVLSDEALPLIIKKTLAYETLYGKYPETLKERMMQSMLSGVAPGEMVRLLDPVIPATERLAILDEAANSISSWLTSEETYPQMTLGPGLYFSRLGNDPEFLVRWIYKNFTLPPMRDTVVAKFNAGEFSDNFDHYMGTPPDSIKEMLIAPAALALQKQLAAVEVPAAINLADQLQQQVTAEEITARKRSVKRVFLVFGWAWLLPVLLLVAASVIIVTTKRPLFKWLAIMLLCLGVVGSLMISPLRDMDGTVYTLVETASGQAPAPALAILFYTMPVLLAHVGELLVPLVNGLLIVGLILLAVAYKQYIHGGFETLKQKFAHGKHEKIEAANKA